MNIDPRWKSLRLKFILKTVLLTIPGCLIGPTLVEVILGLKGKEIAIAVGLILPACVLINVLVQQYLVAGSICRSALASHPGDAPGDRLARLLQLPRKLEIYSFIGCYCMAGSLFTLASCLTFGKNLWLVPVGFSIGLALSMVIGIPTTLLFERDVKPLVLEELERSPGVHPRGGGIFWTRQIWYLPYAFSVLLFAILISGAIVLGVAYNDYKDRIALPEGLVSGIAIPLLLICGALLALFILSGLLMARRQREATTAIDEALRSVAAGTPMLPKWVSSDEIGDLSFALAGVSLDMRRVFEQLRLVADGNLAVELQGQSGLVSAFRESQRALSKIVDQMRILARGDAAPGAEMRGDIGQAFVQLSQALGATIQQARTIAQGDLRKDMPVSGELGSALHQMTQNLRTMVGQTQQVGNRIADIVVSLRSATAQLSSATAEQVSALTETANTMTEMSQTSAASAERCAELIRQGNTVSSVVEEGKNGAGQAGEAMNAIASSLTNIASSSGVLAEKVRKVDGIIELVDFLADQSSTLAINASIEAARAGDAGRGFSAVAREMRGLAGDSRKATAQIREVLQEIRKKTEEVDGVVAQGTSTVEEGGKHVHRLGEVIGQLGVTLHDAVGLMRQVEGAARQHQAGVDQVSQALRSMQTAAESIRDGARMLNDLSEQEHALAGQLRATSGAYQLPARA